VDHWYPGYAAAGELDIAWFQVTIEIVLLLFLLEVLWEELW
jgi:hypothetical protein